MPPPLISITSFSSTPTPGAKYYGCPIPPDLWSASLGQDSLGPRGELSSDIFSSKGFDRRILYRFSTLSNVRWLMIDYLDISSFMPRIQRYLVTSYRRFKNSSQGVLRALTDRSHTSSDCFSAWKAGFQEEQVDDLTLILPFVASNSPGHSVVYRSCIGRRFIGHRLESPQARAFDVHVSYILQGRGSLSAARLPWCGKLVKSRPAPCTRDSAR